MAGAGRVTVAVVQAAFGDDLESNLQLVEGLLEKAASGGASVAVIPELFAGPYFCKHKREENFALARPAPGHPCIERLGTLAGALDMVLPISFFERDGDRFYNSVAVVDGGRGLLGVYRKAHLPDGPGYEEKYYFSPGESAPRVWRTKFADLGIGVCWDQWFPECARTMVLAGAELLLFPSAIGSEPARPDLDTREPWQRVMVGHAVANAVGVAAANRTGTEDGQRFYGHSFIADQRGDIVAELADGELGVALATFDLEAMSRYRKTFGLLQDRRPDLYGRLVENPGDETA